MAVASNPVSSRPVPVRKELFFCREHRIPICAFPEINLITLDEIRSVDPLFTGNHWDISQVLFLDTETTGLSGGAGTVAFEIGIGYFESDKMIIRQYIMRDYSEEDRKSVV